MTALTATKPLRLRIPKLIDLLLISDPQQIRWLNARSELDRTIDPEASWLHRVIDRRLRVDMGFGGELLPIFLGRDTPGRATKQRVLDQRLEELHGLPGPEQAEIADYISGQIDPEEIGVTVQQWCGRLFFPHYRASAESYRAGRLIAGWPRRLPWTAWKDRVDGTLARAKSTLQSAAEDDLHCVHGTSIGMENVARSVRRLRRAAQRSETQTLSPDEILRQCLVAPPVVLRSCTSELEAPFLERPLTRQTLVVFLVARAYQVSGDLDDAFLSEGWSRCPAHEVIPEMLRAVWHTAHHDEAERKRLFSKINGWGRLISRAVS